MGQTQFKKTKHPYSLIYYLMLCQHFQRAIIIDTIRLITYLMFVSPAWFQSSQGVLQIPCCQKVNTEMKDTKSVEQ